MKKFFGALILCLWLASACAPVPAPVTPTPAAAALPKECGFTPPAEVKLRYATAFSVQYQNNYKIVKVLRPWRDANRSFTYILVQRGSPAPANVGDAQVIEVPVRSLASLATTHLPYLNELGVLDALVAVGNAQYVNTPGVLTGLKDGKIKAVGNGPDLNLEGLLETQPEMVTTLALGSSGKDDYQALMLRGFKTVIFSDFMEENPLGRAEWLKFVALFFNREDQAEQIFAGIEARYNRMRALAAGADRRPSVLLGFEINGKWNMPGGKSYQAAYIRDAGGAYLWAGDPTSGRIPLSFEAVFEKGLAADYWFDQSVSWLTAQDVLAADARYERLRAFEQGRVYNNNARLNAGGGNDYNESGLVHPDLVLADLISILHPDLLPEHALLYYRPLAAGEQ
ncbi:MAG: ABC transporter substrate-binding protein [Anaerolineae bacterium]|nr:ABC transporter substrate-binding protein [Anaerolineae bacterium]